MITQINKRVCFLRLKEGRARNVFATITYKDGKLSISGVEGPMRNGDCEGSCGQIDTSIRELAEQGENKLLEYYNLVNDWSFADVKKFLSIWDRWHLNDMCAGCEHQRANWNTLEDLAIKKYSWSSDFFQRRCKAENGELSAEEYAKYQSDYEIVKSIIFRTNGERGHEFDDVKQALADGLIVEDEKKMEVKKSGWVYPYTHPKGLLTKPCEVCGYAYGTRWLKEEVPQEVLEYLNDLPDAKQEYPWRS